MRVALIRTGNILKVGLKAILRNKMRSSLTMLGIIIGVGCVITMVAVATGASRSVQASITAMGTNFIMIFPGAVSQSGARLFTGQSTLTPEDAAAIKAECPSVAYVSPGVRASAQVVAGELNWGTGIYGADVDWPFIRAWNVAQGSFFTEADVKAAAKVCLLGNTVAESLFPSGGAAGQVVRIKNVPFRVVGVLDRKGASTHGHDQDDQIVAPYTTVMKQLSGTVRFGMIQAAAVAPDRVEDAKREIEALLRQRQKLGPGQDNTFMMRSQEEIASMAAQNSRTLSWLLGIVGAVIGGFLAGEFLNMPNAVSGINVTSVVVAFIGAVILIGILRLVSGRRRI